MSFKKRPPRQAPTAVTDGISVLPPGTRLSTATSTPTTSTGLRQLDTLLSGGLPLGTLTLLWEDAPTAYHAAFSAYVIAQGLRHSHSIAVASFDAPAEQLLRGIPGCVDGAVGDGYSPRAGDAAVEMNIAWRYQKRDVTPGPVLSSERLRGFVSDFDLSRVAEIPKNAAVSCLGHGVSYSLAELLIQLEEHMEKASKRKLLTRVVICSLSPSETDNDCDKIECLTGFLCRLRALTRHYGAVTVVSLPREVPRRLLTVAGDAVLRVDSFDGRGAGVAGLGREWLGIIVVEKAFRAGFGCCLRGRGDVWVFKRGRRKYVMERATAAPEVEEDADVHGNADAVGSVVCNIGPRSSGMEF